MIEMNKNAILPPSPKKSMQKSHISKLSRREHLRSYHMAAPLYTVNNNARHSLSNFTFIVVGKFVLNYVSFELCEVS
jgi:hypothetical protein